MRKVACLSIAVVALWLSGCEIRSSEDPTTEPEVSFSTDAPQPLELDVTTSPLANGMRIGGRTNLPDGTELMVNLQRGPVLAGTKVAVQDGRFSADLFPRDGNPIPNGDYDVEVSTPLGDVQPEPIKAVLGSDYEALTGPLLVKSMFGGRIIEFKTKAEIGGPANPAADKAARQRAYREHEARAQETCRAHPDEVEKLSGARMTPAQRAQSVQRCMRGMEEAKKELITEGLIEP